MYEGENATAIFYERKTHSTVVKGKSNNASSVVLGKRDDRARIFHAF